MKQNSYLINDLKLSKKQSYLKNIKKCEKWQKLKKEIFIICYCN